MDVWHAAQVMVRRWYVTLPVLILTAVAAVSAGGRIDPTYSAGATAVVIGIPGPAPRLDDAGKPLPGQVARPSPALSTTEAANAVTISLNSAEAREAAKAAGVSPDYVIGAGTRSAVFNLNIETADPEGAVRTAEYVLDKVDAALAADETLYGSRQGPHYESRVLAPVAVSGEIYDGLLRIRGVVVASGLLMAIALAFLVEALASALRRHRRGRRGERVGAAEALAPGGAPTLQPAAIGDSTSPSPEAVAAPAAGAGQAVSTPGEPRYGAGSLTADSGRGAEP